MKKRALRKLLTFLLAAAMVWGGIAVPGNTLCVNAETDTAEAVSYEAWKENTAYVLTDLVSYKGKIYECTYAHTSHGGWLPDATPTLWKERTDLVYVEPPVTDGETEGSTTEPSTGETVENNYTVNTDLPAHMVTGYWHNFVNGSTNLKLSDVPVYYDMICVAFTGNTTTPGEVTFELDKDLCKALGGYTKEEFIEDIKTLKAKGQHVIISVGGAEGRIEINSTASADLFAEGLIKIIEEYGFEGVDIDLEGSAVAGVDYIAGALRTVQKHFGDKFIITMAPETYYLQADRISANDITTSYLRLALEIKDILTICYPQFYNSGGMNGYGGSTVNPGNADFLTSLTTLIIEAGLRPDQVAIGVPSTSQAAGSGYVSTSTVTTAVNALVNGTSSGKFTAPKAYPTLRGVMTWSINWDATIGYAWSKDMAAAMDALDNGSQAGGETEETIGGETGSETGSEIGSETGSETEETTGGETGSETGEETTGGETGSETGGETTGGETGSETGETTGGETGSETGETTWSATTVYTGGDTVLYNGKEYKAKWWTMGDIPSESAVWELTGNTGSSGGTTGGSSTGVAEWNANTTYSGGSQVTYNGKIYEARWWTQGTNPESSGEWGVWKLIQ